MKEFRRGRASHGSFIVDGKGTILGFDESMEALTGWPAIDVVGRHKELRSGAGGREQAARLETIPLYEGNLPTGSAPEHVELKLHCRDGCRLDAEALKRPLNGPGDRILVTVLRVVASTPTFGKARLIIGRDALTGLLDGEAFWSQLAGSFASARAAARPLSLVLLDVDHLRTVNDRRGREAGDELLRTLSGIVRVTVEDELRVARIGEDLFAVLLENGGRGEARRVAATLRSKVERHRFFVDLESQAVTISLGTASFPADADTERELFERASEALAEAQSMGRNRVWCYLRRPRVPVQVPVYFDGTDSALLGYMRDLSPSGIFLQTTAGIDIGMRCALAFPLPGHDGRVHVVGRVVRTVPPQVADDAGEVRIPGLGVEFERFGGTGDRRAIDSFLHARETTTLRPESGILSVDV